MRCCAGVLLENNVGFHVHGSCYYVESGTEEENVLRHNLGAYVLPLSPVAGGSGQEGSWHTEGVDPRTCGGYEDPTDAAAAPFYLTNLYNVVEDNAASGGFFGFSFPALPAPVKMFREPPYTRHPAQRPALSFHGNIAHSSGWGWLDNGACIYTGGKLYHGPDGRLVYSTGRTDERDTRRADGSTQAFLRLTSTRLWLCNYGITDCEWFGQLRPFAALAVHRRANTHTIMLQCSAAMFSCHRMAPCPRVPEMTIPYHAPSTSFAVQRTQQL